MECEEWIVSIDFIQKNQNKCKQQNKINEDVEMIFDLK